MRLRPDVCIVNRYGTEGKLGVHLRSGDAFVMGGPSRLRDHGIARILPATAPPMLGLAGRLSLTFRQFRL
jgi:alkylated DNA repair protein (DNA oxidative demethylase)